MNFIAKCMLLTGQDANAALLLMRVAYWMPKATIERAGLMWVAKTGKDWQEETGLSPEQYRDALRALKDKGLLATEQHFFGAKCVTHLRLKDPDDDTVAEPEYGPHAGPASGQQAVRLYKGDTVTKLLTMNTSYSNASSADGVNPKSKMFSGEDETVKKEKIGTDEKKENQMAFLKGETIKELLAKAQPSAAGSNMLHKPVVSAGLEKTWMTLYAEAYSKPADAFTINNKKQLKQFREKCWGFIEVPTLGVDEPDKVHARLTDQLARNILREVLLNWMGFAMKGKSAAGLYKVPTLPSLGFLLKYAHVAFGIVKKASEPQKVYNAGPATQPATEPDPVQSIAPPEKPAKGKAAYDEFLDFMWSKDDDA